MVFPNATLARPQWGERASAHEPLSKCRLGVAPKNTTTMHILYRPLTPAEDPPVLLRGPIDAAFAFTAFGAHDAVYALAAHDLLDELQFALFDKPVSV
jgi:hypothetical protein